MTLRVSWHNWPISSPCAAPDMKTSQVLSNAWNNVYPAFGNACSSYRHRNWRYPPLTYVSESLRADLLPIKYLKKLSDISLIIDYTDKNRETTIVWNHYISK
jgi:hypothetical protein